MVALKQVRDAANLPTSTRLTADMYQDGVPHRLTAVIPLDVGVTLREAIQLEDYIVEHAAVGAAQIATSLGLAAVRDFALACARFGYRTFYVTFETVLETKDGVHQGPPIGFRATTVYELDDVHTYLDNALRDAARVYDERYATALIGVPTATVRCCLRKGQYVRAGRRVELPHELAPRKTGFTVLEGVPDGFCFMYALLYHCAKRDKSPLRNLHRRAVLDRYASTREGGPPLDFGPLEARMAAGGIDVREHAAALTRFENVNGLSLCLWQWDGHESIACRARPCRTSYPEVCLLQVESGRRWHFFHCTNPAYFLHLPLSAPIRDATSHHTKIGCGRCGAVYSSHAMFRAHEARCRAMKKTQNEEYLALEDKIRFKNARQELRAPVCVYADFEAINVDDDALSDACKRQTGVSWGMFVVTEFASRHHRTYRSHVDDEETEGRAAVEFLAQLFELKKQLYWEHKKATDAHKEFAYDWTDEERDAHEAAEECARCGDAFEDAGGKAKVLHHCHLTGRYLGAFCSSCNTSLPVPKCTVRVFFHNLNYDLANVLHALAEPLPDAGPNAEWGFQCLGGQINHLKEFRVTRTRKWTNAEGKEKFATTDDIQFIDSFAHLSSGLEGLLRTLPRARMHHLRHAFGDQFDATAEGRPIVGGKSLFPYDHFTSVAQLDGPIPERAHFFSQLTQSAPTDAEWAHFVASNAALGLTTFRALHDFYLKVDVIGLADVFENYRRVALEAYALDPAYSLTAPGYSWQCMLRMTRVEFDGVPDAEMMDFLEAGKRGGVSCAVTRHVKANYPDDPAYDASLGPRSLVYLDANNLYGKAMSYALPTGGLRWADDPDAALAANATVDYEAAGTGYFFEVDLHYPEALHDAHAAMPLAPVKRAVRAEELTDAARAIWEQEKQTHALALSNEKLLTTLEDKERYVVWGSTLRQYVSLGLEVTRVHRALACAMAPFLKPYIDANTAKRNEAKAAGDGAKSDFYKLMNNAVFGKTMENVRERGLYHVFREGEGEKFTKVTSHPHFRRTVFDLEGRLTITESDKRVVKLDKPLYVGVAVLDISKEWMYRCFYEHVHKAYGPRVQLVFTDTDSLCLAIDGDWYADVRDPGPTGELLRGVMDFSGYAPEQLLPSGNPHKGRLGYLKDECAPHRLLEAFALRAKMHAELLGKADGSTEWHQKCKGVPKSYVKRLLHRDHWVDILKHVDDRAYEHRLAFNQIRAAGRHEAAAHFNVLELNKKKRTLSFYDDKRAILGDGLTTLPYGHKRLRTEG